MELAKTLITDFSTADAEYPTLIKEGGQLIVKYENWKEQWVELVFSEVVAFKWQECVILLLDERDDCCYEIERSLWLELHRKEQLLMNEHKHYRFNFNGNGQLEVISLGFAGLPIAK